MSSELRVDKIIPVDGVPSGGGGGIIQIKNTIKTDSFTTSSTSSVDITGFSATITPKFSTSKILVCVDIGVLSASGANGVYLVLLRGSTAIANTTIGSGNLHNRSGFTSGGGGEGNNGSDGERKMNTGGISFLDSPSTTSAVTYKCQLSTSNSSYTAYFNRWGENTDNASVSTITLMEVSA